MAGIHRILAIFYYKQPTMKHVIENQHLSVTINELGGELTSIVRKSDGMQMLWQGDAEYWHGQSPILFPAIGNSANQTAHFFGKEYPMTKHGLIRTMQFALREKNADSITLEVTDNESTRQHYPYAFSFAVRYALYGNTLGVSFIVSGKDKLLPFHVGAHPAFNLPDFNETDDVHGFLKLDVSDYLLSDGLKPGGLRWKEGAFQVPLKNGMLELGNHTFDCDTILDTRGLAHTCELYNKEKVCIVKVTFEAPVLALWAPKKGCCPFVCIEPWWGCCDDYGFNDEFSKRHWINTAQPGEKKIISYSITIS